jgi:diaminopropionate ammonia-lyase
MDLEPRSGAVAGDRTTVLLNRFQEPALAYGAAQAAVLARDSVQAARRVMSTWPGYATTPLIPRPALAQAAGLAELWCKDESQRFGLGSFKALGGAYAVYRCLSEAVEARTGARPAARDLLAGRYRATAADVTVTSATDGNHGRSVAWGAQLFGCPCVIYMHRGVTAARVQAIERFGAKVERVDGTYDDSVRVCALDAASAGRQVISDTAYEGYTEVPCQVMQGYGLIAEEIMAQRPADWRPTHIFLQAGCGGFAAAVYGRLWEAWGAQRPRLVLVEPTAADCVFRSCAAGELRVTPGSLDTLIGGLACGEVSLVAWPILKPGAFACMTIEDGWAVEAMRRLARNGEDQRIVAGEAGASGVAGLLAAAEQEETRRLLGLDASSRVVTVISEGATDPQLYRELVGLAPPDVLAG